MYCLITEDAVRKSAEQMSEYDESNSFAYLLRVASEYKQAGMTPIYILDMEKNDLYLSTQEKLEKKLH
jgi:hypothetical protein